MAYFQHCKNVKDKSNQNGFFLSCARYYVVFFILFIKTTKSSKSLLQVVKT